jgi:hypothetical protein
MDPSKLVRDAGFDTASKEGRAAYQAIKRWSEGRKSEGQESRGREGKPGEYFARHLPLKYRRTLFIYIRDHHHGEYIKPLPNGQQWITFEESERWNSDTHSTEWVRRDRGALEDFVGYIKAGGTTTQVTRHFVRAEINYAGGESNDRMYGPAGGLTEEDYRRLADDDLLFETQEELAWGVIDNLLWRKGLLTSQIRQAHRRVPEGAISKMVEVSSFDVVAAALYKEAKKAPKKQR